MAYVAPIHRPNSVRHALRIRLFPDEDHLVIGKANRLEIWKLQDNEALVLVETKAVNGTISFFDKLRPRDADTEMLFVGTERFQYFTVMWEPESNSLVTINPFFDINEKCMRDSQSQDKCIVDPTGRFMVILLWEGIINCLRMLPSKSKRLEVDWMDQVRISELFIKSATFLHSETGHPKLAFLYQTRADLPDSRLVTYRLMSDDKHTQLSRFDLRDQEDNLNIPDPGAAMLIPVGKGDGDQKRYIVRNAAQAQAQLGGIIVVGETRLLYYDDAAKKTVEANLKTASIFVAWSEYDASHYFVGDDYGTLWILEILLDGAVVTGMEMWKIGETSRANNLVYMGDGVLFVGSHYGDSQLFAVDLDNRATELLQILPNIGPILDLQIMDMGNREGEGQTTNEYSSGQARIVTGSGVHKDGSLRSVRSGVGLEDVGVLPDMEHVRCVFALRSPNSPKLDTLVVSFLTETRIFTFSSSGDVEEVEEYQGLAMDTPTLLAKNLPAGRLLQVTTADVRITDAENGVAISTYRPMEGQITNVSANDEWLLISVNGTHLLSLQIQQDIVQVEHNDLEDQDQVACVHLPPQYPNIGVVGFWKSGTVSIIDLKSLHSLHSESLRHKDDQVSVPRDIVLAQILPPASTGPSLFVSMGDGFVINFNVSKADFSLSGRKSVVLGTRHARLDLLPLEDGIYNIFATSEHPSLIYGNEGRIVYSAVTAEDATCVCHFDAEAYPDSVVVATNSELKISVIDTERRTHTQPLPMRETVRRIAYSRAERVFGLGCIKREVINNEEIITSYFRMVDEVVFQNLGQHFDLDSGPRVEMIEAVIRAELIDSYGNNVERFLVGTSYVDNPGESYDGHRGVCGRILILGIDSERMPYLVGSRELKGACRSLAMVNGMIVAALAKTVVVYAYLETTSTSAELRKLASYRPATYPVDLAVHGNMIAVADLMKSMSLVELVPATDDQPLSLREVARHHQAAWATAVCHIEGSSWLEADSQGNMMVLRKNEDGVTSEDRLRMDVISEMNLGEQVNRIRKVTVDPTPNAVIIPKAFLGTVEGGVYMFGTIAPNYQDLLIRFQNNLADRVQTTGDITFSQYRSFRNEERESDGPFRFVDGELLERFLDMDEEGQKEVVQGLGPDVEALRNLVEELKRMH